MVILDLCGEKIVFDLTDEIDHPSFIIGLLQLPKTIILSIFNDYLMIKNIDLIFKGNLKHIKNALYNQSIINSNIEWGRIYRYHRKDIYKLVQKHQFLNRVFYEMFKKYKERAKEMSEIVVGTIIEIKSFEGLSGNYIVDKITAKSVLGIEIEIKKNVEVKDNNGKVVSNLNNVVELSNKQRWLDIDYLKQEHHVLIIFEPTVFFTDHDNNLTEIIEYRPFIVEQTKFITDYSLEVNA